MLVGLEGEVDAAEVGADPCPVAVDLSRIGAERVDLELRVAVGEGGRIRGNVGRRPAEAPQLDELDGSERSSAAISAANAGVIAFSRPERPTGSPRPCCSPR